VPPSSATARAGLGLRVILEDLPAELKTLPAHGWYSPVKVNILPLDTSSLTAAQAAADAQVEHHLRRRPCEIPSHGRRLAARNVCGHRVTPARPTSAFGCFPADSFTSAATFTVTRPCRMASTSTERRVARPRCRAQRSAKLSRAGRPARRLPGVRPGVRPCRPWTTADAAQTVEALPDRRKSPQPRV